MPNINYMLVNVTCYRNQRIAIVGLNNVIFELMLIVN